MYHLFITAFTERRIKTFRRCFFYGKQYAKKIIKERKEKIDNGKNEDKINQTIQTDVKFERKVNSNLLLFPYQGEKGLHLTKSLKTNLKMLLPSTVKANICFTGKKLSACFQIKVKTKFEHKHDII